MARQGHPCAAAVGLHPIRPAPIAPLLLGLPLLLSLLLPPEGRAYETAGRISIVGPYACASCPCLWRYAVIC